MFGMMISLLVLSLSFALLGGMAFFYRKLFLKGSEGRMYPVWVVLLILSILPIRISLPAPRAPIVPDTPVEVETVQTQQPTSYQGDFSEFERAELVHGAKKPVSTAEVPVRRVSAFRLTMIRAAAWCAAYAESAASVLFAVWLAGAAVSFALAMNGYHSVKRVLNEMSEPLADERVLRLTAECAEKLGIAPPARIRLITGEGICSPCVSGVFRPVLYLEEGCLSLGDRELSCVLTHELCHIRRKDMLFKLTALFASSVHWFNPMAKKVLRWMFEDCELACDYGVVRVWGREAGPAYMGAILDFAERYSEKSRLIGAQSLNGGLFASPPSGAVFLKRRYANMKNFRKNTLMTAATAAFAAVCVLLNLFVFSSCSGIMPGALGQTIPLTAPVESMVRSYYGMSNADFITPAQLDGITELTIVANSLPGEHVVADFVVNGDGCQTSSALPPFIHRNRWDSVFAPALEELENSGEAGRKTAMKFRAFYCLKDIYDEELEPEAVEEMKLLFPELEETFGGAAYILDPYSTQREITALHQFIDEMGLLDPWVVDSTEFDASSLAYFPNLAKVTFVGFTPVGYEFPEDVEVNVLPIEDGAAGVQYEDRYLSFMTGSWRTDDTGFIAEPSPDVFKQPTDGSEVVIPENASLNFALREYFIMNNWDYFDTPLTTAHTEKITSIRAEVDEELSKIIHESDPDGFFKNAKFIRYTINGCDLGIVPNQMTTDDWCGMWQSHVSGCEAVDGKKIDTSKDMTDDEFIYSAYEYNQDYDLYVLREGMTKDDQVRLLRLLLQLDLMKVAIVGQLEDGTALTEFMSTSSKCGGVPARFLDSVSTFSEDDRALFPNLTEWSFKLKAN